MSSPEIIAAVIVTRARPRELARCLKSLREASLPSSVALHIHVAVNGHDPASQEVLASHPQVSRILVDRPLTPAAARNRALDALETQPSWLLFIDDDAQAPHDFFEIFLRARQLAPAADVIGGPNLTPDDSSPFQIAVGLALSSRLATYLSFTRYRPRGALRPSDERELALCNLFIRPSALPTHPFPEALFCGEENLLLNRLSAQSRQLFHDPRLSVLHDRRSQVATLSLQVYRYGKGRAQTLRMLPKNIRPAHWIPSACLLATALCATVTAFGAGRWLSLGWLALAAIYAALCVEEALRSSLRERRPTGSALIAIPLFPLIHLCYGTGFMAGLIRRGART